MRFGLLSVFVILSIGALSVVKPPLVGYLGGSGTDDCDGIAFDKQENIYLACHSDSPNFPGIPARSAVASNDAMDAVVVKIDSRTGGLLWAVRTGGSSWDAAGEVEVGSDGSVFVLGMTRSIDFPTTNDAVQRRFGGPDRDVFLLKLDQSGTIVYSTFLGGSKNDEAGGMAVTHDGMVYIGGVTGSADFPGRRIRRYGQGGKEDTFIVRLRPGDPKNLQTILLGGTGVDHLSSLALDGSGGLFATGYTFSDDFPLENAVQQHLRGKANAFLAKLRLSDWRLLFSTYFGGSQMDGAYAAAVDSSGNPVISGVAASDDLQTSTQAFQRKRRGTVDAFLTKFSRDGSRILWSTYYGGSKQNSDQFEGGSMAVDPMGRVWLVGATNSSDLPTRNPSQPSFGGGDFDGFIAGFSSDGSKLCYGSYFGGNAHDILEGLAIRHRAYASGITASPNITQERSRVQPGFGGGPYDAIFADFEIPPDPNCH